MKNISHKRSSLSALCCVAGFIILLASCKKDDISTPVITGVRNYAAAPNDTVINTLIPGQWVVLSGHNLKNALQISFDGVPASFNRTLFSDDYAVVQVPEIIPFPSVPEAQMNTIQYVTDEGTTSFTFNIVAPPPVITSISNENANEGDSVYIYGTNLFLIKDVVYAGTKIANYASSVNGTSIGFVLPKLSQSGIVAVTTESGKDSTVYNVNDIETGMLCNFDDVNTFSWGTSTSNSSSDFPGNRGYYAVLNNTSLNAGDGSWWNWQRSINTNSAQWVAAGNLSDPIDNYALKFEINVPNAWNGVSIFIIKDYSWTYVARYEPWKNGNATFAYKTKGWCTVTIPLTSFKTENGKTASAASLSDLLGSAGSGGIDIYTTNDGSDASVTGFYGAIDNIRVVRIK